ncbi:MAG TPA: hypothetical protein VMI31_04220 [Fimbriimonadaceae bacterium]|nr:hypothetical protein [Fimbriimonadaceae bacterium]
MRKPIPFFPLVLAAFPIVALYAVNYAMVPIEDVWRPLGLTVAGAAIVWLVFALIARNVAKGAVVTAVFLALFFTFGLIGKHVPSTVLQGADVLILGLVVLLVLRSKRDFSQLVRSLNFGATVLIVLPLIQILTVHRSAKAGAFLSVDLPVKATAATVQSRPDIFFIIVDCYGRADQLKRVMGYSNDPFVSQLRSRGFFVADRSHSNYDQTQLSIAATLNLTFVQDYPKTFPRDSDDRRPLSDGTNLSFAASYLRRLGYKYIAVTSGYPLDFHSADLNFKRPMVRSMIENTYIQFTPITVDNSAITTMFEDRRDCLVGAFQNLKYLAEPMPQPKFVVAHILAPHPPFVFDANGRPIRQPGIPFGFYDGSDYMGAGGTHQTYRDGYVGQVQFLNGQLLQIIDAIVSKAKTPPVIIIEGDHGSKLGLDQNNIAKTDLHECMSNFMAFYVPPSVKSLLYPQITSINTFRTLFDGLFNEHLPLAPDRSYYSPFTEPYQFVDVTKQVADQPLTAATTQPAPSPAG